MMLTILFQGFLIIIFLLTLLWLLSIFIENVSIVDIFWGSGFVVVNLYYFFSSEDFFTRQIILLFLVTVWGLRLSIYLALRNLGKGEDYRYQEFRRKYGPERYWWFSFFQVFLLQGILISLVSLPLIGANYYTEDNQLNFFDYAALITWIFGFIFEAGGDFQLAKFKNNPNNKGKVLKTGLWKYTRHPNYFGDTMIWWSFALFSIASGSYWTIIGSILMTLLILKVSGVVLLEKSLKVGKPDYNDYIMKTNSFFPWFPTK